VSPEEDLTELSARNKEAEDVTVMSSRERGSVVAPPLDEDDDQTRMSARAGAGQEETADVTRLSRRSAAPISGTRPASGRKARGDLPPGAPAKPAGGAAQRGAFGQPAEEYAPREAPSVDGVPEPEPLVPQPPTPAPGVDIAAARERREAARHRRLITAVLVVGITAAVMTAALIGILALVRGE